MTKCKNCGANEFALYETIMHYATPNNMGVLKGTHEDSVSLGIDFIECAKCDAEHYFIDFQGVDV